MIIRGMHYLSIKWWITSEMHKQNAQVPEEYVLWTKKKQRRVLSIQIFLAFEIFTNAEMQVSRFHKQAWMDYETNCS